MSQKHFEFADFVEEFRVDFIVIDETPGDYNDAGTWVEGIPTPRDMYGIILPLSTDDMRFEANGSYTAMDRKIYTTTPLIIGQKIEYKGQAFTIDQDKPYSDYADVYIYFAKGVSN